MFDLRALLLALALPRAAAFEVVIIGGGWAGFTAAHALSRSADVSKVTLLEAGRAVGGLSAGWTTPAGRPVEAGMHGFVSRRFTSLLPLSSCA